MDSLTLVDLERVRPGLEGTLFTTRQLDVLAKRLKREKLTLTEKTYYYKFIRPKLQAAFALCHKDEIFLQGKEQIIPERRERALQIIRQFSRKHRNKKMLLTGSFLYSETYNDIDLFIFSKYKKEDYRWKNIHVTFLHEQMLSSLFAASLMQISVGNFLPISQSEFCVSMEDVLKSYELLVQEIVAREPYDKTLRTFLLQLEFRSKRTILNSPQLHQLRQKFMKCPELIFRYAADSMALAFSKEELPKLRQQVSSYRQLQKVYRFSRNIPIYLKTYQEVIQLAG